MESRKSRDEDVGVRVGVGVGAYSSPSSEGDCCDDGELVGVPLDDPGGTQSEGGDTP